MRRSGLFWGSILIVFGVLLLLQNFGILRVNVWGVFWPTLLILLGLWTLWGVFGPKRAAAAEQVTIPLDGASRARLRVGHGAGRLEVSGGAGPEELVAGSFGGGLDYQTQRNGDALEVRMRTPSDVVPWMWGPGGSRDWSVRLNSAIPLTLDFGTGASESHIDLSDLRVTDLKLETGASSTHLTLPANAGHTQAEIEAGAASVNIRVPEGVAARIRVEGGLISTDVDTSRFPQLGGLYQSADYDSASNRVDLRIEGGAGSIKVR